MREGFLNVDERRSLARAIYERVLAGKKADFLITAHAERK